MPFQPGVRIRNASWKRAAISRLNPAFALQAIFNALIEPAAAFGERGQAAADPYRPDICEFHNRGLLFGGFLEQAIGHGEFRVAASKENLLEAILRPAMLSAAKEKRELPKMASLSIHQNRGKKECAPCHRKATGLGNRRRRPVAGLKSNAGRGAS